MDTYEFLEHCENLGAGGIHAIVRGDLKKIRMWAEAAGMYIEAMVPLPEGSDTTAFEEALKSAQAVGAVALRAACLGTRRYETFSSIADWREFVTRSHRSIEAALPVLDRFKIPLGLENHKDWTLDELHDLVKEYSSEYFGVCLDLGNNIALLDDPVEVIETLAPYTVSTHFKNVAVQPYEDGVLLSEVRLGDGILDVQHCVSVIKKCRPGTRFSLEMITRDPLKIPCLTDAYWASFPDRNGRYLARTLKLVQANRAPSLPMIAGMSHEQQLRVENENVVSCLKYAREQLEL